MKSDLSFTKVCTLFLPKTQDGTSSRAIIFHPSEMRDWMYFCVHSVTQSSKNHLYWPSLAAADKERINCPTKHKFPARFTALLTHSCLCSTQHNFTFWTAGKIKNIFWSKDAKYKDILMCTVSFVWRHKACNALFIRGHYLLQNSIPPPRERLKPTNELLCFNSPNPISLMTFVMLMSPPSGSFRTSAHQDSGIFEL